MRVPTVQQLRNNGYKVRVLHNRLYNGYHKWQVGSRPESGYCGPIDSDAKGGSTVIIIDSPKEVGRKNCYWKIWSN